MLCEHGVTVVLDYELTHLTAQKHIRYSSKSINTVTCKLLNSTNILYVFNPILITNVFAADLH